ncbi:Oxidoreductase, molybdopterin-binding domain-containing protein [Cercophora scortea]|uniref:Nitrate reductase [NADPH] n=1 Tax=Cercophora scortea TaxID=314031 RepID=A0AAE0M3J8_9PEZI|nr:Oxidoreductase, molybdopterin-binding domain-containing protein [Cercophora scortea]
MATQSTRRVAVDLLRLARRPPVNTPTISSPPSVCQSSKVHARALHGSVIRKAPTRPNLPQPGNGKSNGNGHRTRTARAAPLGLIVGGSIVASVLAFSQQAFQDDDHHDDDDTPQIQTTTTPPPPTAATDNDDRDPSLPRFRLADIRQHGPNSDHPWVTLDDKVYDITDWLPAHPGGDVILRAAGGSIEPYWNIFTIHKSPHVLEILSQYLIGYISTADLVNGKPPAEAIADPFDHDPVRDPRMITHTAKPRNAEPPNAELDRSFLTPNDLFYIRHHMWVPPVDPADYALTVELPDGATRHYTLSDLTSGRFPTHRVTAALQCSGNRRNDMTRHAGTTNGLQWGVGAISNAEWEGIRLADVLADAGLPQTTSEPLHVQFTGLEAYGASIPLAKAVDPRGDVLLAFKMNGSPLPPDHGFPLRAVVPGHVAARSVKWLSKIVVSDEESTSQWQRRDYKSFGPNEGKNPDWDRAPAIQEMPVTSAITGVWVGECARKHIREGGCSEKSMDKGEGKGVVDIGAVKKEVGYSAREHVPDRSRITEPVAMHGYAYSGGGRAIARVDVSLDGGKTWDQAELVNDCDGDSDGDKSHCFGNKRWAWTRWRYTGQLPVLSLADDNDNKSEGTGKKRACTTLVVKATDDAYNTQPETHSSIYNVRGNLATAWHRVRVCPSCTGTGGDAGGLKKGDAGLKKSEAAGVKWSTGETYGCGFGKE